MPLAHPSHVVSFSSEDPHHPASNLLNRETFRKWKCKNPGEKEAFVILKFDKAEQINCVDIGNDGAALIEVSVARSGTGGDPNFEVLLSSTAFMSPLDSREGKNMNTVKSFSNNLLSKPIAEQKWDLVKIQACQPFNRHVQYGLTFVKFVVAPDPNAVQKIGGFAIRKAIGGEDSDEELRPGSLFTNKLLNISIGGSKASSPRPISPVPKKLPDTTPKTPSIRQQNIVSKTPSTSSPSTRTVTTPSSISNRKDPKASSSPAPVKPSPKSSNGTPTTSRKRQLSPDPPRRNGPPTPVTSRPVATPPPKKQAKKKLTKPFNKLMEGVIFSMSGFENPLRGQLRDKAIEMGARYKADWDGSCTHLLCAFYNTPKFKQVKGAGHGKIVKKEWIEKCYSDRIRYPWRRFCLDRKDSGSESDEEVHAEGNEEEILDEPVEPEQMETSPPAKAKKKRVLVLESSDDEKSDESKKAYDAETDIDDPDRTPDLSPSVMDNTKAAPIFKYAQFCLDTRMKADVKVNVENIIKKRKGQIDKKLNDSTEYFVCQSNKWNDDFTEALSDNPNLIFIRKEWILECDIEDQLLDKESFVVSPN